MLLRLHRSERLSWMGSRIYVLTAHIECDPEEQRIVSEHGFTGEFVYISPQADELLERAEAAYERQRKLSIFNEEHQRQIAWDSLKALTLYIRAGNAYRITVADLLAGTAVECRDLVELIAVERAITSGFDQLKRITDLALTFENGAETVLTPDDDVEEPSAPPSAWPDYKRS